MKVLRPRPTVLRNWLGNVTWQPARSVEPRSEAELVELVRAARRAGQRVRVLGAGHSWTPLCATSGLTVRLDRLSHVFQLDRARGLVTVEAGIRLHDLCERLAQAGLALYNLGSIRAQSLAGALLTGTHGSGLSFGCLATQVVAMRLITGRGEILELDETTEPDRLDAARVSLGALGLVTRMTLRVCPAFRLCEEREPARFADALALIPDGVRAAEHLKLWWFPLTDQVQIYRQRRTDEPASRRRRLGVLSEDAVLTQLLFSGILRLGDSAPALIPPLHRLMTRLNFQPQRRIGPSADVFTLAMPPVHHESEYAVPLTRAAAALAALHRLVRERGHRPHFVCEVRFVRGDSAWLSPAYGGDVCYIGGYDSADPRERRWPAYLRDYEALMLSFGGRPHWGKEFHAPPEVLAARYPRWADFCALRKELDPDGVLLNPMLERLFQVSPFPTER
jgi:L-gulonolactone oxidase